MIKAPLAIIVGIAYLSLTASAQMPRPDLSKYFNPAALPGFSVPSDVTAPIVTEPRFISVAGETSETAHVLAILSQEKQIIRDANGDVIQKVISGRVIRLLIAPAVFSGEDLIPDGQISDKTNPLKIHNFYSTNVRGKLDVIFEELDKPEKKLRRYLVSPDGTLLSAVETIKVNGKFIDQKIPNENVSKEQVEVFFKAELEFWKTYYKTVKLAQKT
jgi:hypothetical protein